VLVESTDIKSQAFRSLYRQFGPRAVAQAMDHHKSSEGISRLTKIQYCHRQYLGVDLTQRELAALGRQYSALVEDAVVACDGVAGARRFLDAHHNKTKLFVASGTPQEELKRIVGRRAMTRYFAGVYGSPALKEEIVAQVLAAHGLDAGRALFIGDAMADYTAAGAHGVDFIGRVAPGKDNPFPHGTKTIADLTGLAP
jgi:phosphoglycolate phosphatase-like HAD superfamily hydrolase